MNTTTKYIGINSNSIVGFAAHIETEIILGNRHAQTYHNNMNRK